MKPYLLIGIVVLILSGILASASTFTVSYSEPGTECSSYCVYKIQPSYTAGIASSTAVSKSASPMSITSTIDSGQDEAYVIFTKTGTDVSARESYLAKKTFTTMFDPSFGYPIRGISKIRVGLGYKDIYLNSTTVDKGIGPGLYSLIFRNKGQIISGPDAGKTQVFVSLS